MSNSYSAQEAVNAIEQHRVSRGGARKQWYAGIAKNPENRLFNDHNVHRQNGHWRWVRCLNEHHTRAAEDALLKSGYTGGNGGGSTETIYLYAYRITPVTTE